MRARSLSDVPLGDEAFVSFSEGLSPDPPPRGM